MGKWKLCDIGLPLIMVWGVCLLGIGFLIGRTTDFAVSACSHRSSILARDIPNPVRARAAPSASVPVAASAAPSGSGRPKAVPQGEYAVVVDYDRSLPAMIEAGKYGYVGTAVRSMALPKKSGKGKVKTGLVLVGIDAKLTVEEAKEELARRGYRPAKLPELLAFGAKYPDVQETRRVLALGTVLKEPSSVSVPFLGHDGKERYLSAIVSFRSDRSQRVWGGDDPFLCAKK